MSKVWALIKRELRDLFPVWLFFFAAILVIALYKQLLFSQYGLPPFRFTALTSALIGSAIVAKVFLIVDHIPIVERFSDRPLIYVVLWKTAFYTAAAIFLQFLEEGVKLLFKGMSVAAAIGNVLDTVATPHFWAVQIWVVTLFSAFILFRELFRAIGKERIYGLLFGERKTVKSEKRAA